MISVPSTCFDLTDMDTVLGDTQYAIHGMLQLTLSLLVVLLLYSTHWRRSWNRNHVQIARSGFRAHQCHFSCYGNKCRTRLVSSCKYSIYLLTCFSLLYSVISLALFAKENNLVRPDLTEENVVYIKGGRCVVIDVINCSSSMMYESMI